MLNIRKRDGSLQEFNLEKVSKAIEKAFMADHKFYNDDIINMLSLRVTAQMNGKINNDVIDIEDVQDAVEVTLIQAGYVDEKPEVVERARDALRKNGIEPVDGAIRGGTDGATFSKNGLITPNLGTGSYNHHGRFEFLDVYEFNKMISVVIGLVRK